MNIKLSAIVSGAAFILSLGIGLLSGAGIFALVRALILGAVFFLISGGCYRLVVQFLPELLSPPSEAPEPALGPEPGSQVDVSLEEEGPDGIFEDILEDPAEAEPPGLFPQENVSGIDQLDAVGYTQGGVMDEKPSKGGLSSEGASAGGPSLPDLRGKPALPADDFNSVDELPDMDSLASGFVSSGEGDGGASEQTLSLNVAPGNARELKLGDGNSNREYSTHDMASAIQTILKRD